MTDSSGITGDLQNHFKEILANLQSGFACRVLLSSRRALRLVPLLEGEVDDVLRGVVQADNQLAAGVGPVPVRFP